jgi:hypothetical protein
MLLVSSWLQTLWIGLDSQPKLWIFCDHSGLAPVFNTYCLMGSYETSLVLEQYKHKNDHSHTCIVEVRNVRFWKCRFTTGYVHGPFTVMEHFLCLWKKQTCSRLYRDLNVISSAVIWIQTLVRICYRLWLQLACPYSVNSSLHQPLYVPTVWYTSQELP